MKPRHAAALALVGWYLMVPPPQDVKHGFFAFVPLSQWTHKATFDTEVHCKREISKGCLNINQNGENMRSGSLCRARCVASDDPRLKETK
jgi:hypothetical protein